MDSIDVSVDPLEGGIVLLFFGWGLGFEVFLGFWGAYGVAAVFAGGGAVSHFSGGFA